MIKALDQILAEKGLITETDIERAREIQGIYGGQMGEILIRLGAVGEGDVLDARGEQLGFPIFTPDQAPRDLEPVANAMERIAPIEWWVNQGAVAWRQSSDGHYICVARDPAAPELQEAFEVALGGASASYHLAFGKDIDFLIEAVKEYQSGSRDFRLEMNGAALKELGEDAPTIEFINKVMSQAVFSGASDIHIEPTERAFVVRFRIDGVLTLHTSQSLDRYQSVISRIKLLSGLDIAERRLPQDGRQTVRAAGKTYDLRVSTLPGVNGESVVIRLLGKQQEVLTLPGLGLRPPPMAELRRIVAKPHGIFLVTGPTGSGKSTTLHAALHELNDGERKIITVEDPVEYNAEGITQVQVKSEIGLTFAKALRSILRQDPDVIMIGEIRDRETADIAIQSALTGHMVFSTLHTNNAIGAVTRLLNMGVEAFLLGAALEGMMAQRLVRRVCSRCCEPFEPPAELRDAISPVFPLLDGAEPQWRRAVGCKHCANTGYRGRLGVFELVRVSARLREGVSERIDEEELIKIALDDGYVPLYADGLVKAAQGETTLDEVTRVLGEGGSAAL